jgi:hypothetical protein
VVHYIGAAMVFVLGTVYCCLQSYLSYATIGDSGLSASTKFRTKIRILLCIIATLTYILTVSMKYFVILVSTFSEWIMVFCLLLFYASFYREFKYVEAKFNTTRRLDNPMLETEPLDEREAEQQFINT